ncbi:uncharacterized protein LOC100273087 [Zea mays]|nr:uncharacterized protein LOC100273087 [Zea mays]ACF85158.1 unknown [Zea mays]ACG38462.1 hypothetical protein [Zea mays]ONM21350.1 hypothetical protein ZEAMMB73_Zm00001d005503 [Zea mays]|eukprot:NP_001141008.1 uncharacterized protein LOC100273087 [Zea mays]
MDTVAPRLSRSSTRYGPISSSAASFSGPVRKWRKAWVPLTGTGTGTAGSGGGSSRGDNKVVLFRWTPVNGCSGGGGGTDGGMELAAAGASTCRRRYVPAAGEAQSTTKKGTSSELNLNLELEDPDDDTDADMSTDEPRDVEDNSARLESRLKRKAF